MFNRAGRNGKALSVLIVWTMVLGGVMAIVATLPPAVQAGLCDQVGGVITGTWTITTAQVCTGIVYTVDGSITINAPGSLTLIDGGLSFAKDGSHQGYALTVNAGATLVLDNSIVTVQTNAIRPYLHLALTVSGAGSSLVMDNGAMLKFPGWFNATSATVNVTDSTITGFNSADLTGLGVNNDLNDDSPIIDWATTTASVYGSRVERLYEEVGGAASHLTLRTGSNLYAYDTYLGVDYASATTEAAKHNELRVDGTSNAFLYNVSIDMTQAPASRINWDSAFRPTAAGGNVYLFRWLHATVEDSDGAGVSGATIWSRLSPGSQTALYPDRGPAATVPTDRTLWYIGRTQTGADQWNRTDAAGMALIPLWTDHITQASLPNALSFGNYEERASYLTYTADGSANFPAYPDVGAENNNIWLTLTLNGVQVCPSGLTTWSFNREFTGEVSVSKSLEISGDISITDGGLYVDQQSDACAYVRILPTGSLTLVNSRIWSNYRLSVYVSNGASFTMTAGSQLLLTQRSVPGLLSSEGTTSVVSIYDSTIDGDAELRGASTTLVRDAFLGPGLTIDTVSKANLWDASLNGITDLALLTDDGNVNSVDFDIRNTTFDQAQTSQLVFAGSQNAQLTSVSTYDPTGSWWTTMITGNAVVSRYWWLTVRAVDGTGTLLANANATVYLNRTDPSTLQAFPAPNPGSSDLYLTNWTDTTWPILTRSGQILYRAFAESRTVAQSGRVLNNSYVAEATASIAGTGYHSDSPAGALLASDMSLALEFSSLTPDFSVTDLTIVGGNGASSFQPIDTDIMLTATIRNTGQIDVRNVTVTFFANDVDRNDDGVMDFSADDFRTTALIADVLVSMIPKSGSMPVSALWHPEGAIETSVPVTVVVDPPIVGVDDGGEVLETEEHNNILDTPRTYTLYTWPDLSVLPTGIRVQTDAVVDNTVNLLITVSNDGTARATDANVTVLDGLVTVEGSGLTYNLDNGLSTTLSIVWRPTSTGSHTIRVIAYSGNSTIRNKDYDWSFNAATAVFQVYTPPDLVLRQTDFTTVYTPTQTQTFTVNVVVHNDGQTPATGVTVAIYYDASRARELGRKANLSVSALSSEQTTVTLQGIDTPGYRNLTVVVDPANVLNEGGAAQEANNAALLPVSVQPPQGSVSIDLPGANAVIQPGQNLIVTGFVRTTDSQGIPNVFVEIQLMLGTTPVVAVNTTSDDSGLFTKIVPVPASAQDGQYSLVVRAPFGLIQPESVSITVKKNVPFLDSPFPLLGLPWWLMLIIFAAVAALVVGVTLYFKFYGLGKMVECGECGAFIPEDATICPKCGVEFEKDMAKCSNCQAWIPVDVKQCPECGVEFATGEVEMADYQEKMRLQYDEVVQKFKEEASRQLGRALSDREFQEWWRKQPTFVTFEDWLREEEEMRKMGSKPCPTCGTLNSVTATVCHKCGSLMKQEPRPPSGGAGGGGAPVQVRRAAVTPTAPSAPPEEPSGGAQAAPGGPLGGTEAIPRRVIRRPVQAQQPVVQKKVIKRPLEGGQSTESAEGQTSSDNPEDEL